MDTQQVLDVFRQCGAILEGHFVLTSGLHSPVFLQKARVFMHPDQTEILCKALAEKIRAAGLGRIDLLRRPGGRRHHSGLRNFAPPWRSQCLGRARGRQVPPAPLRTGGRRARRRHRGHRHHRAFRSARRSMRMREIGADVLAAGLHRRPLGRQGRCRRSAGCRWRSTRFRLPGRQASAGTCRNSRDEARQPSSWERNE